VTEGSAQDEDESEKGPDLFAHLPGYQPFQPQQTPVWPGQKPDPQPPPQPPANDVDEPRSALPEAAAPMLKLPSKPKTNRGPNLDVTRLQQQREAQLRQQQISQDQQYAADQFVPGQYPQPQLQYPQPQQAPQPQQQANQNQQQLPVYYNPGQAQPGFTPPEQPSQEPVENPGFVPTNQGAPETIGQMPIKPTKASKPVITSASAKPDWTQPQWPQGKPDNQSQTPPGGSGRGNFGPANPTGPTGNDLPPAIAPLPQAPYSQAPPTLGNISRGLFARQSQQQLQALGLGQNTNPNVNAHPLGFSQSAQATPGLKALPYTIKRDFALAKELFGNQANQGGPKERHEYKQTDFIPQQPKLKVAAPDPDRPWTPVPAAHYEFFAEEEKAQTIPPNTLNQQNQAPQSPKDIQFARGFNLENPLGFDQDPQVDPRYAPFQGELQKDILRQDKRFGGHSEDNIPAEKRERGAAALRALNRNSDRYYENQNTPLTQQDPLPQAVRLTSRDLFGLATYYCIVTKEVLTTPQVFFANMSLVGGLNDPLIYLAFTSIMTGIFSAVAHLNLLYVFFAVTCFLQVVLAAVLMQLLFKKLGGQGKFEQTFNVLSYSSATFIFAWICLGPIAIGGIVAGLYTAYLNYIGLSRVQKLPPTTTAIIIIVFAAIPILFWRMFSVK